MLDNNLMVFDKSNFRIRSFDILPFVRDFFKQPTGERNLSNVDEIRRYLSDIKPFSRIRKFLQDKILLEGWYECYSERQTIVRQGSRCACFYIILSGSAIVTYRRLSDDRMQTIALLERGCTFGEKGLMTNSFQQFTITSKTKMEFLVLWKEDFKAIYMADDRYCSRDDLKFLKTSVPILRGFPVDRLNEFPHAIQHCNYSLSEVVAKDSRRMKHIFVVKKGSLMLWKRLDPHGGTPKLDKIEIDQGDDEKMMEEAEEQTEETQDNKTLFSEIQLSGDINQSLSSNTALDADLRISRLRRVNIRDRRISSSLSTRSNSAVDIEKKFPGIADKRDRLQMIDYEQLTISNSPEQEVKIPKHRQSIMHTKSKLILPDHMLYVHIKTLNKGQSFGLTDMLFPNQPALTLISEECECLLLRKSSFTRIASDQYKQTIRRTEIPYPPDSVFYQSYHMNEVWKHYSKDVYRYAVEKMKLQHPQPMQRSRKKKQTCSLIKEK